jgi:hypothetical protein
VVVVVCTSFWRLRLTVAEMRSPSVPLRLKNTPRDFSSRKSRKALTLKYRPMPSVAEYDSAATCAGGCSGVRTLMRLRPSPGRQTATG